MRRTTSSFLALVVCVPLGLAHSTAAPGTWTVGGPFGGSVAAFAVSPHDSSLVFAGTRSGVFKSSSAGARWFRPSSSWAFNGMRIPTFHPTDPNVFYASGRNGVFKTTNAGEDWVRVSEGERMERPHEEISISRADPSTVYVAEDGVFRSRDAGGQWTHVLEGKQVWSMDVAQTRAGIVYVATPDGLFKTTDGGDDWTRLPIDRPGTVAVDPTDHRIVYLTSQNSVLKSTDGGATWQATGTAEGDLYRMAIAPSNPSTLYAWGRHQGDRAVYAARSDDAGATWTTLDQLPGTDYIELAIDPTDASVVYAGTIGHGIYKSTNGGESFAPSNTGLTAGHVRAVAVEEGSPPVVYAGLENAGLFRSMDGGSTWEEIDEDFSGRLDDVMVRSLAVHPADGSLYVGMRVVSQTGTEAVPPIMRSPDRGETWIDASGDIESGVVIQNLIADPQNPHTLFAGVIDYRGFDARTGGLYKTTDGGSSWSPIGPRDIPVSDLAFHSGSGTLVASMGEDTAGSQKFLAMSPDRGNTWNRIQYPPEIRHVSAITMGHSPELLFAGAEEASEVSRSGDGGKTWDLTRQFDSTNFSSSVRDVVVDPINPSEVYVGTDWGGLWISPDYGESWSQLNPGIYGVAANAIAFEQSTPQTEPEQPRMLLSGDSRSSVVGSSSSARRSSLKPLFGGVTGRARSGVWRVIPAPDAYRRPRISGTAKVGRRLECSKGRWTRARRFSYRWLRDRRAIKGADNATYRVRPADKGDVVACRVRARGPGGRSRATSRGMRIGRS